jgi:hypothetical protein
MSEEDQLRVKGITVTKYVELKSHLATLGAKADQLARSLDRVSQALKAPVTADPTMPIPEPTVIRSLLEEIHETATELQSYRQNLQGFGIELKD